VPKYPFLSDEWMEAARAIQAEFEGKGKPSEHPIRMNQIITDIPFPPHKVESHLNTTAGDFDLDMGHIDNPDVTVTMPWDVAKGVMIEANQQLGMQAFLEGRIRIDGDMTKLMVIQAGALDPIMIEAQKRIQEITE
jgi:hypothetical protein